jgi:hypothetical protein
MPDWLQVIALVRTLRTRLIGQMLSLGRRSDSPPQRCTWLQLYLSTLLLVIPSPTAVQLVSLVAKIYARP